MSIQTCFRPPANLYATQEANLGLRAKRSNSNWWRRLATNYTIAEADAEIKEFVAKRFGDDDDLTYGIDLRTLGADWVRVKGGIGEILARQSDESGMIEFCPSTGGGYVDQWTWRIGDPPLDYWWTTEKLRDELLGIVHRHRVDYIENNLWQPKLVDNWFRDRNNPAVAEIYHRAENVRADAMRLAHGGQWQECHALVSSYRWPLYSGQTEADLVWSTAEYILRQWLRRTP